MKILFTAPLKRRVDSKITAARPRVIFDLISGLIKKGHRITVLGTGDTKIKGADIVPVIPKGFVNMPATENPYYTEIGFLAKGAKILEKIGNNFDVIHNHAYPEFVNLLVADKIKKPVLTTVHAQITPELDETLSCFNNVKNSYLVSLSNSHKRFAKKTKFWRVIYNGVDTSLYKFKEKKGDYLLWLGRLSKAKDDKGKFSDPKGVRWAMKLAEGTGEKLLLSGNVEDPRFFDQDVNPHLSEKIRWMGGVFSEQPLDKKSVAKLMRNAKALLMTVNWEEPFGLVMAEAMSCGTPVIAFDRGSVKEVIADGKTGFIVKPEEGVEGLKKALREIPKINPKECREHVEKNFSLEKMVDSYEKAYKELIF